MKITFLIAVLQLAFAGVCFGSDEEIIRVELGGEAVEQLEHINTWLDENLNPADCPERVYYGLIEEAGFEQQLLGYEVLAHCPDAPIPNIVVYFDASQDYVEPTERDLY